jgi:hypothetical protein
MKSSENQWLIIVAITSCIWVMMLPACASTPKCANCNGSFLSENYTSAANWQVVPSACTGTVNVVGGAVLFDKAGDGRSKRVFRNLPTTLNYDDWTAEAQVRVRGGDAPAMDIIAFTNGTLDPWYDDAGCLPGCGNGCTSYTPTNQDGVFAYLGSGNASPSISGCCQDPAAPSYRWSFFARAKRGNVLLPPSPAINLPALGTYFVRLQRTWHSQGMISVFSDSLMKFHLPGSPQCFQIDPAIVTLNVLQHDVHTVGSNLRINFAEIDNLRVCSGNTCPLTLTPSFTANPDYCPDTGTPITVDGSATVGTPFQELNHEWLITECDQFGNTTFSPLTTWSQWYPGLAGAFTFPASLYGINGGFIKCGKYYLVRLGVQNCGNRFESRSRVIRIKCNFPC